MLVSRIVARSGVVLLLSGALPGINVEGLRAQDTASRTYEEIVRQQLDSLEQVAASVSLPHEQRVRAILRFARIGQARWAMQGLPDPGPGAVRFPGVVRRLGALYRGTDDPGLRWTIIGHMIWQAERAEAVAFLETVADPSGQLGAQWFDHRPLSGMAIETLGYMGPEGAAALERLRARKGAP